MTDIKIYEGGSWELARLTNNLQLAAPAGARPTPAQALELMVLHRKLRSHPDGKIRAFDYTTAVLKMGFRPLGPKLLQMLADGPDDAPITVKTRMVNQGAYLEAHDLEDELTEVLEAHDLEDELTEVLVREGRTSEADISLASALREKLFTREEVEEALSHGYHAHLDETRGQRSAGYGAKFFEQLNKKKETKI
jgi:hypothetical protein